MPKTSVYPTMWIIGNNPLTFLTRKKSKGTKTSNRGDRWSPPQYFIIIAFLTCLSFTYFFFHMKEKVGVF